MRKLIAIVGPTASGKSELAMRIAHQFDGEIIAADSRTIYQEMNIGVAKPTNQDRKIIKHHLLDLIKPNENFSAAKFKILAQKAILGISARKKIPILVGGSGLYLNGVIYNYNFRPKADPKLRKKLEQKSHQELIAVLELKNPKLLSKIDIKNKRRLIRAIETTDYENHIPSKPIFQTLIIGIDHKKIDLEKKISQRINQMFKNGLIAEIKKLNQKYDWRNEAMSATGYKTIKDYLECKISLKETKLKLLQATLHLAKKQHTWFKRDQNIIWINETDQAIELVSKFLNK